jgi:hypothetical protein
MLLVLVVVVVLITGKKSKDLTKILDIVFPLTCVAVFIWFESVHKCGVYISFDPQEADL